MSKDSDERETPKELFNPLNEEFHFTLDVCAFDWNKKCDKYFNIQQNGLKQNWAPEICFMNPPYSEIPLWLDKAYIESQLGAVVVCILPCDTSTKWFHNYLWNGIEHKPRAGIQIRFPQGRYKFEKYSNTPKFATIIAVMKNEQKD